MAAFTFEMPGESINKVYLYFTALTYIQTKLYTIVLKLYVACCTFIISSGIMMLLIYLSTDMKVVVENRDAVDISYDPPICKSCSALKILKYIPCFVVVGSAAELVILLLMRITIRAPLMVVIFVVFAMNESTILHHIINVRTISAALLWPVYKTSGRSTIASTVNRKVGEIQPAKMVDIQGHFSCEPDSKETTIDRSKIGVFKTTFSTKQCHLLHGNTFSN